MARTARTSKTAPASRLRVSYTEAHRVRLLLLSDDVEKLNARDVQTILKIIDDVYPMRTHRFFRNWQPFLVGIGIGILLILGLSGIF
jgi:hypothetical protein